MRRARVLLCGPFVLGVLALLVVRLGVLTLLVLGFLVGGVVVFLALAFEALGHGICYIGGLRNRLPEVDSLLELPSGVWPLYGLCVGEAAERPSHRPRLPLEAVWFRDRYPSDEEVRRRIAEHDEVAREYYAEREQPGRDWSGGTWRKFRRRMREGLKDYYESKGARGRGPSEGDLR